MYMMHGKVTRNRMYSSHWQQQMQRTYINPQKNIPTKVTSTVKEA